jgi:hypothetical protein
MSVCRHRVLTVLLGAALTACAQLAPPAAPSGSAADAPGTTPAVEVRGRFIELIGLKAQHAPPYLGTPGTNFYCLRSFVDRKTGETADQLYVSDSYDGTEHNWDGAHDGAGRALVLVPISHDKITCDADCSYVEEFAADIPESELRASRQGFAVTFSDRTGDEKTITVSADQIAAQLAAVDAQHDAMPFLAGASAEPPTPAAAHQP